MKSLLPIVAALALAGCTWFHPPGAPATETAVPASRYQYVDVAGEIATPAERAACKAAGGEISRAGMLGWQHCVQTYPDAGKVCSGDADCEGTCRADTTNQGVAPGKPATGTCQTVDVPFGCYAMIEDGKMGYTLCVD
ncbi:MAG: hypothetical protein MUE84_02995 [Hyphomonas sp.]|jgi:hypothetical protein|nr:hypothetical protein [Hyphomonas sp.]